MKYVSSPSVQLIIKVKKICAIWLMLSLVIVHTYIVYFITQDWSPDVDLPIYCLKTNVYTCE